MTLRLNGSTSGYVEIDAPATAGSNTLVLPTGNGTNGQYLQTNGSGSLSWATLPTAGWTNHGQTATTSGSSHTVTGISTSARVIKIAYSNISVTNTSTPQISLRMGNGSLSSADYYWGATYSTAGLSGAADSLIRLTHNDFNNDANSLSGVITIVAEQTYMIGTHIGQMSGSWSYWGTFRWAGGGSIDRIAIGTGSTFDAGHFVVYSL